MIECISSARNIFLEIKIKRFVDKPFLRNMRDWPTHICSLTNISINIVHIVRDELRLSRQDTYMRQRSGRVQLTGFLAMLFILLPNNRF